MTVPPDFSKSSFLWPDHSGVVCVSAEGEIIRPMPAEIDSLIATGMLVVCHKKWTETRLGQNLDKALDVLELFAFIRPAQVVSPTPSGLASRLGLAQPNSAEDKVLAIAKAATQLLDELAEMPEQARVKLAEIAEMMRRGGWRWSAPILLQLGVHSAKDGPPDGRNAAVWSDIPEISDSGYRPPPGIQPVMPDAARTRLSEMLGSHSEVRSSQSDYAAAAASIFASPDSGSTPFMLLAEAGTGTGKTLGYLAPASLWAERNDAAVWISTYTRTLQHQIADELSRLYPDRKKAEKKVVVRKGRENYLCLLNLEDALGRMPGTPADAAGLGLMARWASATPDGDLTGNSFPSWLIDLIGTRLTRGLADRRGECIHSACTHYHKCFVEKSIRTSRHADIVIANHALVMINAAMGAAMGASKRTAKGGATSGQTSDNNRPTRYIFDEGHHIFDAADSAFSAGLTAYETAEMRLWLRGSEDGRRGRARGLQKRLGDLIANSEEALAALDAATEMARLLPGTGWKKRISENAPANAAEQFFCAVRNAVYQRASDPQSLYNLQVELYPATQDMQEKAQKLKNVFNDLSVPLTKLATYLQDILDEKADTLDSQTRNRLEGAQRGLMRRATGPLAAWQMMLNDLQQDSREGFIDWIEVTRSDLGDVDVGQHRHWLDPMIPFSESVLAPAHGVAVTSATLRDNQLEDASSEEEEWHSARLISGAAHLPHPALVSAHKSPFDYQKQARIFVVNDISRERYQAVASAMAELMKAAGGGSLGLFTSIARLKSTYPELEARLRAAGIPLHAQHMDRMSLQTLLQLFREDSHSCLVGTDAVRDGVDVPGEALRMIIYDRVPWPRPDMLFKARAKWQGRDAWTDRMTRMRLRQAFGRLIRRADDKGVFVMLDSRLPTRLTSAFPNDVEIIRTGLVDAITQSRNFLKSEG